MTVLPEREEKSNIDSFDCLDNNSPGRLLPGYTPPGLYTTREPPSLYLSWVHLLLTRLTAVHLPGTRYAGLTALAQGVTESSVTVVASYRRC